MLDFHAATITYATDYGESGIAASVCFKCKKDVVTVRLALDDVIVWTCPYCAAEGRISTWQVTLWDVGDRPERLD